LGRAIGPAILDALRRRGERVRLVNRSGTAPVPDDVEVLGGDASDPAFATAAAKGAQVVYQTLNPPYHQWVELFPGLQASVLAAAQATGARLVSMENVYMYGRPNGQPLTETRPYAADIKKGTLRARMARDLLAAHQAGRVQVAIGRASDYFGPRGGAQSILGDRVIPAALAGKTASVLGDPDQPHTYTYLPDIGEGLAVLGEHPDAPGEVWHLPNDPQTRTTRQLVDTIYQLAASPRPSCGAPHRWCCEPWGSSTPLSGSCSSCSTSSRNPSLSTAPRSPPSWMSTPPRWTKPWPTPWPATPPRPAKLRLPTSPEQTRSPT
jgi:nucleoside-diphosphate-sugar epimerase